MVSAQTSLIKRSHFAWGLRCYKLSNQIFSGLLLVSDPWVLVQRGTDRDKLVCKHLQCLLFVLAVGAVDALEGPRIITCEHLKSIQNTSVKGMFS